MCRHEFVIRDYSVDVLPLYSISKCWFIGEPPPDCEFVEVHVGKFIYWTVLEYQGVLETKLLAVIWLRRERPAGSEWQGATLEWPAAGRMKRAGGGEVRKLPVLHGSGVSFGDVGQTMNSSELESECGHSDILKR